MKLAAGPALLCAGALLCACVKRSGEDPEKLRQAFKAKTLDAAPDNLSHKLDTDFSGKVRLLGARVEPRGSLKPGQTVKLTLYWKSQQALDSGYRLFTHVLDASGERILNIDNVGTLRLAKDGDQQAFPPEYWQPGKVYADDQTFVVPEKLDSNRIKIVTGLWRGHERLAVTSGARDSENRATVASLAVRDPTRKKRSTRVPELRVDRLAADVKLTIDGKLDEPAWKSAPSTGRFVDVSSGEPNTHFPVNGSAKILWNEKALFVAFEVEDQDVVGGFPKEAKDPWLWKKDTVELMVDPDGDGDNRDYYEIQVNPQNLVFDSQFDRYNVPRKEPNGPFGHQEWSAKLTSAVSVRGTLDDSSDKDEGYVVEAMIPWASFEKAAQRPPAPGDTWRMNFYAMQNNGGVSWSPILGQGNFHKASRFGRVLFATPGWEPPAPAAPSADPKSPAPAPSGRIAPTRRREIFNRETIRRTEQAPPIVSPEALQKPER